MGSPKVVFILGSQRGGTTIFGRLLGEVDGFVFAGAVRRLWLEEANRRCSCGRANDECPLWSEVLARVAPGPGAKEVASWQARHLSNRHSWLGALRLAGEAKLRRPAAPTLQAYVDVADHLYDEVAELAGARVVVDTSKHPNDAVALTQRSSLESYLIQIVRDPRGSAYSVEQRESARQGERRSVSLADRSGFGQLGRTAHATLNWVTRHAASEAVRRGVPADRSLLVRYEDLAERPVEVLQRVASLVGEQPAHLPSFHGGRVDLRATHAPSCAKLLPAATVPFRLDDRWIGDLNPADAAVATLLAWPLMLRYRYPLQRPPTRPLEGAGTIPGGQH